MRFTTRRFRASGIRFRVGRIRFRAGGIRFRPGCIHFRARGVRFLRREYVFRGSVYVRLPLRVYVFRDGYTFANTNVCFSR